MFGIGVSVPSTTFFILNVGIFCNVIVTVSPSTLIFFPVSLSAIKLSPSNTSTFKLFPSFDTLIFNMSEVNTYPCAGISS